TTALNPSYHPPSRGTLSNTLIPSWYEVERKKIIDDLTGVSKVSLTSDGWTSITQDHHVMVTVHYVKEDKLKQNVLTTQAVYVSQTGPVVAEEIEVIQEFDNAANMEVAARQLQIRKLGCFAHTLNLAAHIPAISKWSARIRDAIVWIKRSSIVKSIFEEKQHLLGLPSHSVVLDVKTRWNSLFLMVERFVEQYPAIQAAFLDARTKRLMKRDLVIHSFGFHISIRRTSRFKLEKVTEDDLSKAEEFVIVIRILYTSTLCVSSDRHATCGQILPIFEKLEDHFSIREEDSHFVATIKEKVWSDLSKCYQVPIKTTHHHNNNSFIAGCCL
ncbi:putative zinc finger BED domain-containing protein 1-like, partial [Triplophysa rosa]